MVKSTPATPPTPARPSSATLSISQLREKLKAFGVSSEHCIEKAELVKLLNRAEFKAGRVEFKPTHRWQTVESFHLCPMGLQYEMDMKSGTTLARLSESGTAKPARNSITTKVGKETPPKLNVTPRKVGATPTRVGATPPKIGATPPRVGATPPKVGATPPKVGVASCGLKGRIPTSGCTRLVFDKTHQTKSSTSASSSLRFTNVAQPKPVLSSEPDLVGNNRSRPLRMQSEPDLTRGSHKRTQTWIRPERRPKAPSPAPSQMCQSAKDDTLVSPDEVPSAPTPTGDKGVPGPVRDTSLYDELPFEDKDETERRRRRRQTTNGFHTEIPRYAQDSGKRRRTSYVGETAEDIPYLAPLHPEGLLPHQIPEQENLASMGPPRGPWEKRANVTRGQRETGEANVTRGQRETGEANVTRGQRPCEANVDNLANVDKRPRLEGSHLQKRARPEEAEKEVDPKRRKSHENHSHSPHLEHEDERKYQEQDAQQPEPREDRQSEPQDEWPVSGDEPANRSSGGSSAHSLKVGSEMEKERHESTPVREDDMKERHESTEHRSGRTKSGRTKSEKSRRSSVKNGRKRHSSSERRWKDGRRRRSSSGEKKRRRSSSIENGAGRRSSSGEKNRSNSIEKRDSMRKRKRNPNPNPNPTSGERKRHRNRDRSRRRRSPGRRERRSRDRERSGSGGQTAYDKNASIDAPFESYI